MKYEVRAWFSPGFESSMAGLGPKAFKTHIGIVEILPFTFSKKYVSVFL